MWTHWGLNPGPSACEADVIPLHHVPHGKYIRISMHLTFSAFAHIFRIPIWFQGGLPALLTEPSWYIRCSIVVSISACHAEDPGSIPGGGAFMLTAESTQTIAACWQIAFPRTVLSTDCLYVPGCRVAFPSCLRFNIEGVLQWSATTTPHADSHPRERH